MAAPGGFSLKPLMFTAFSGTMAMMAFVAVIGPMSRELSLAPWHVGLAVTVAGIAWMLMARVWGARSDAVGRRRVLLIALAGFSVSYIALSLFLGAALHWTFPAMLSLAGMIAGRALAGAFYAAVPPVCAAIVAEHVAPQERTKAMGALGAGNALGLVIGPGAAGLLAAWSLSAALYVIAILPVVALAVIWRFVPRDGAAPGRKPSALKLADARIRRAIITAFTAMFGVVIAQVVVGFYALDRLGLPTAEAARTAGIALAMVGAALFVSQLVLRRLSWPPMKFIRIGGTVAAAGFGAVAFADTPLALYGCYGLAAAGMGWVYPSLSALAANSVEANEQGAAAGALGSAQGLAAVLGPIAGTMMYQLSPSAPYSLAAVMILAVALWPAKAAVR